MKGRFKLTRVLKPSIVLEAEGGTKEEAMANALKAGRSLLDRIELKADVPPDVQAWLDKAGFKGWVPDYIIKEIEQE